MKNNNNKNVKSSNNTKQILNKKKKKILAFDSSCSLQGTFFSIRCGPTDLDVIFLHSHIKHKIFFQTASTQDILGCKYRLI